jgi:TetR/AcrR family transcriptional regulator, repressor for neighboring sulfatase
VAKRRARSKAAKDPPSTRVRRTPQEARATILLAAEKLLAERGPDAVGLKEVAAAAGVSHGLVSHYFGTYEALVEETLEKHAGALRAALLRQMAASASEGPDAWIEQLFAAIAQPLYGRLAGWALLSGRMNRDDFFARRDQGLREIANAIEARYREHHKTLPFSRDDLEFVLMLVLAAAFGYSMGRPVLWASVAREPSDERDAWFRRRLAKMVEGSLLGSRGGTRTSTP